MLICCEREVQQKVISTFELSQKVLCIVCVQTAFTINLYFCLVTQTSSMYPEGLKENKS